MCSALQRRLARKLRAHIYKCWNCTTPCAEALFSHCQPCRVEGRLARKLGLHIPGSGKFSAASNESSFEANLKHQYTHSAAQTRRIFQQVQGRPCRSATHMPGRNLSSTNTNAKQCAQQRQRTRPRAKPPAPPNIKLDLPPHFAKHLHQ